MRAGLALALAAIGMVPGMVSGDVTGANARAKSGDFDRAGVVGCSQEAGQTLGTCEAVIAGATDGAVVVVTFPNGFSRMLMFEDGAFLRGNATMSGVGTDTEWSISDGIYRVRVDDQRFEIPEALVWGE